MDAKHTPGPWYVTHDPLWPWDIHIEPKVLGMHRIAHSTSAKTYEQMMDAVGFDAPERPKVVAAIVEQEANARLIAAAPDMLAALKFIADREDLTFAECTVAEEIVGRARAALAKAESTP